LESIRPLCSFSFTKKKTNQKKSPSATRPLAGFPALYESLRALWNLAFAQTATAPFRKDSAMLGASRWGNPKPIKITSRDPGSNVLLNYLYSHDKMDNIIGKNTEHGDYGYQYDDFYRLTGAEHPGDQQDEAFTYDTVGNRLTSVEHDDWTYNSNNELVSYDGVTYEYDANGNMVKKTDGGVITSFVYNIENRLVEVWNGEAGSGSLTARYYYDPFGRRLWKEAGGVRTYFHYSDEGLIAEADASGNVVKSYGYKPGSTWMTDPLFMKVGDQYYFYHNDHLGTPQEMTAVNGAVVWRAEYSSFGEATVEVEAVENHLRFPGQYFDAETGLHYNWHRYYDPGIGRYLRADPIGLQKGKNHLFAYVLNNPINLIDPLGLLSGDGGGGGGWGGNPCDGYKKYFNSKCKDECNEDKDDTYPKNAINCCNDFLKRYSGKMYNKTVKAVASCLVKFEAVCQRESTCKARAKCRRNAHAKCYWRNKFIPLKGIPMKSCWPIGRFL